MSYEKTVTAAVAETRSKFRLAEALAEDIPPRRTGPSEDATITEYLVEARQAIIDAGGEDRSTQTLRDYRWTALWVRTGTGANYRWVAGFSFTAHSEARQAGLSYDEFAAVPRTTDRIRREAGKAGTDGPPARIIGTWTPEQKADAARELLADPQVAHTPAVREAAFKAIDTDRPTRDQETQTARRRAQLDLPGDQIQLIVEFRKLRKTFASIAQLMGKEGVIVSEEERDALLDEVVWMRNALDLVESGLNSGSIDEELATILGGES